MNGIKHVEAGSRRRVSYYYDPNVGNYQYSVTHPMKPQRMRMTHSLVTNYGLSSKMQVLVPPRATKAQMTRFHTDEYIDFITLMTPEVVEKHPERQDRFAYMDDCPLFQGLIEFCSISAGGSIAGANKLNEGEADVAINWSGGLHHAKKNEASGFCYVNDIVLAILELLRVHQRVLYIDIDVHHGDGVEEAFYTTDRVMTVSLHKYGNRFFPGTGDVEDIGIGKGKHYAVNVPLRSGINDETYASVFQPVISRVIEWYRPGAIVLQCGADSLAGDKLGTFNLSMYGHANCVEFVKSFNIPMLVLGGGGYTIRNVARAWTYETSRLVGTDVPVTLPFDEYSDYYYPNHRLEVPPTNMANNNSPEYLNEIIKKIVDHLRNLPFAPSAPIRPTMKKSIFTTTDQWNQSATTAEEYESEDDEDELIGLSNKINKARNGELDLYNYYMSNNTAMLNAQGDFDQYVYHGNTNGGDSINGQYRSATEQAAMDVRSTQRQTNQRIVRYQEYSDSEDDGDDRRDEQYYGGRSGRSSAAAAGATGRGNKGKRSANQYTLRRERDEQQQRSTPGATSLLASTSTHSASAGNKIAGGFPAPRGEAVFQPNNTAASEKTPFYPQ
ncbi:hypothetical protein GQ42DRAFT_177602 [Ramicandelaber brevisporus]|nr:hypothetical protein GQ42DRAFT_177602 [Ramicandelaber brevisporus]